MGRLERVTFHAGAGSAGQGRPIRGGAAPNRGRRPDRDGQVRAVAVSSLRFAMLAWLGEHGAVRCRWRL
jgi:hypothetical protein